MNLRLRKDSYHIEMDDLSRFTVERSPDGTEWDDISHEELDELLDQVTEGKAKNFLSVLRGGGISLLGGNFYRIRPQS